MTRQYAKRYLKLLPHRLMPHLFAFIVVSVSLFGVFALLAKSIQNPPSTQPKTSTVSDKPDLGQPPQVSAKHIFILEKDSGTVIYEKDADARIYPASTTKIATAIVTFESYPLDQVITVDQKFDEGQSIGFEPGEQISVQNLLYALLVESGNDAAEILAKNYCDPNNKFACGRGAFVASMNDLSQNRLHLQNTNFLNPTGLDEDGHYSSASDLARLAIYALNNDLFTRLVSTENAVIASEDSTHRHVLKNTNELLGKLPGVFGVKTGFTDKAGQSLISLVKRNGKTAIFCVFGSNDRFSDTQKLVDWVYPLN